MSSSAAPLSLAVGLALVHLFAGRLRVLDRVPRSQWLSAAGGASVAYVFVHVLPELAERGEAFGETVAAFAEHHVYLVALVGFVAFYGLERYVKTETERAGGSEERGGDEPDRPGVFWLHIGSFAGYNALIGYLLFHREESGPASLAFFGAAMGLHFLVNDSGLRDHHERTYRDRGRWVLSAAVLAGAAVGLFVEVSEGAVAALFGFLAGSVVLNVIKEELPEERESRFRAFALGAGLYAALLLLA